MKREIKFRAWDKINERWFYWIFDTLGAPFQGLEIDEKSIEQYTGLKDKNGKEIFEGDIVKTSIWSYGIKSERVYKVVFRDGKFTTTSGYGLDYASSIEVIGSIYENPELL